MIQVAAGDAVMRPGAPQAIKYPTLPTGSGAVCAGLYRPRSTGVLGSVTCGDISSPHPGLCPPGLCWCSGALLCEPWHVCSLAVGRGRGGGQGCAVPREQPWYPRCAGPSGQVPAGLPTSPGSGYKAQAAEHPPIAAPRDAHLRGESHSRAERCFIRGS